VRDEVGAGFVVAVVLVERGVKDAGIEDQRHVPSSAGSFG
jgi:hypothetical protein